MSENKRIRVNFKEEPQTEYLGKAQVWRTDSATRQGRQHFTMLLEAADNMGRMVVCTCEGFTYQGHCKHVKEVLGG